MPLRVLFFNYEFPPVGGGAATFNDYLFRQWAGDPSVRIDCVTCAAGRVDEVVSFSDNITLHRLAVNKKSAHSWTQPEVLRFLWRARKKALELAASGCYDLSHAFAGFPSGLLSWQCRTHLPYLISLLGSDVPGLNPRLTLQYKVLSPLFHRIWRGAQLVVANSMGLQELAQRFEPGMAIPIIPGGIDTEEFSPPPQAERVPGRIICTSRLVENKGVQHLVEAMPQVAAACPDAHLEVVGEGSLLEDLRKRCAELGLGDRVHFCGYVPHDRIATHLRRAEIFAQPTYREGMSNSVMEAMACGLPVVASGEGGREELFDGNAVHVPWADPPALAQALVGLFQGRERIQKMGERSRQISLRYSYARIAKQYLEAYRQVASRPAR